MYMETAFETALRQSNLAENTIAAYIYTVNDFFSQHKELNKRNLLIYTHPKVSDVQVIGVPDKQYGEEVLACVILKEGETSTEEEIKQYVLDHMAKQKVPRYVLFVDSFPMNAAGKILKYKMRENAVTQLNLGEANSIETA